MSPVLPPLLTALLPLCTFHSLPAFSTSSLFCLWDCCRSGCRSAGDKLLLLRLGWRACLFPPRKPTKQHPKKTSFAGFQFPSGSLRFLSSIPLPYLTLPPPLPSNNLPSVPYLTLSITSTFLVSSLQVACPPGLPSGSWCEALGGLFLPLALAGSWLRLRTPLPTRYRGF